MEFDDVTLAMPDNENSSSVDNKYTVITSR